MKIKFTFVSEVPEDVLDIVREAGRDIQDLVDLGAESLSEYLQYIGFSADDVNTLTAVAV